VNPAEAATRGQAVNDYLWQVARKFSQYRYYSNDREEGTVVARLTIARDGRLLGVSVAQSSGFATLDKGVVETIQAAAPYAPLPAVIPGEPVTFLLPVVSKYRR
jgi:protein TonB